MVACVDTIIDFGAIGLEEVGAEDMVDACIDSVAVEGPSGTVARGYVAVCQSLRQGPVCVGDGGVVEVSACDDGQPLLEALLDACGDIPDFDEVQKTDRGHWENRIKTPLETALDSCVRAGVLDGWEYCGAKKAKLSDSEVDIGDYATFIGLYVRFRMGRMNDED